MSSSQEKLAQMRAIREQQREFKKTRPDVLNDDQFAILKSAFYQYAYNAGWTRDLQEAIDENMHFFWDWQQDIIDETLRSVFQKLGYNIFLSVKRQEGKTEIMALILIFCYENYFMTFGDPFGVGIVGPGKTMSTTVFKRLNNYLMTQNSDLAIDQASYKESLRGDSLSAFSISETGGTTIEGKSLNFILRDESHEGSDHRWRDEVLWTTAAKEGATIAMLGCAGYRKCDFMAGLQAGNTDENRVHIVNYDRLKPYMEDLAEKGLRLAQGWMKRTEKLIRMNGGMDSPETRKNVFCEWQCDLGSYLTEEQILTCTREVRAYDPNKDMEMLIAFIDLAYSGDRSIATIMNLDGHIIDMIMLKDANETIALRDQLEYFFTYCDDKEYTHAFQTIGIDKTGLGIGAHEMLLEMSPCEVFPIAFSVQKKFEMFTTLKNHVITEYEDDRITFPEGHEYMPMVIEELTDLEQTVAENGLLKFHAPENMGTKKYDDFCDSIAGCVHVLFAMREQFSNKNIYRKRHNRQAVFQKRLEQNKKKRQIAMEQSRRKGNGDGGRPRKKRSLLGRTVGSNW